MTDPTPGPRGGHRGGSPAGRSAPLGRSPVGRSPRRRRHWLFGRWRRAVVRGPSMSPALSEGDIVLVGRRARVRPGAVVLVRWAQRPDQLSVKRVVGRHGDGWWVLGDNPDGSTDSRQLGAAELVAVVVARLWPAPGRLPRRSSARPRHGPTSAGGA
ncbi:MAG: nickel-type superoxide dismutase maturation protease [Pseudonocardiaceae bacterium]